MVFKIQNNEEYLKIFYCLDISDLEFLEVNVRLFCDRRKIKPCQRRFCYQGILFWNYLNLTSIIWSGNLHKGKTQKTYDKPFLNCRLDCRNKKAMNFEKN
jgi:hypothetical protein